MVRLSLFWIALLFSVTYGKSQIMQFNSGASEPGFTFTGWNSGGGTIWVANLAVAATVTKNAGTWDFKSFDVGPFTGLNTMEVTSDLGNSYTYSTGTAATHTLNWTGVTTITFTRISGSGASADHDNFNYTPAGGGPGCQDPDVPKLSATSATVCVGENTMITVSASDSLRDATRWHLYTVACGGNALDSNASGTFVVTPSTSTSYYVRGEDGPGCVDETTILCDSITIDVVSGVDASVSQSGDSLSANLSGAAYQWLDCDSNFQVIPGETAQILVAERDGNYAVEVDDGVCIDTSACFAVTLPPVGIQKYLNGMKIRLFPNPNRGLLQVSVSEQSLNDELLIRNVLGEVVLISPVHHLKFEINLPVELDNGVYLVSLSSGNTVRLLLQR